MLVARDVEPKKLDFREQIGEPFVSHNDKQRPSAIPP
jgi:hypothetical protein